MNTMKAYKQLLEAGFGEKQSETVLTVIEESVHVQSATKLDLVNTENELKQEISVIKTELKEDISKLELKIEQTKNDLEKSQKTMLYWIVGLFIAQTALIVSLK